jgi:hypothetical protein
MSDGIAAMGVAPHSGWAAVVVLGASPADPHVLLRSRIELIEQSDPKSKQPYHALESLGLEQAAEQLSHYRLAAEARAYAALRDIATAMSERGLRLAAVGVLDSAGRKGDSLSSILASHALIHSADGDHFRNAVDAAARRIGCAVRRIRARELDTQAEAGLHRSSAVLRETVNGIGRLVGPPWGADQKMAALFAWLLLAEESPGTGYGDC